MKKSVWSVSTNASIDRKRVEKALFEAADLWLYLEPQLAEHVSADTMRPVYQWMKRNKDVLQTLADLRMDQVKKDAGPDDLYPTLYEQRFLPQMFHTHNDQKEIRGGELW